MTTRRIDEIVFGERHRRDLGDIASLPANVAELGLLHPLVIRPDGTLIAGERRLLAAKQLGWCEIPVNVMDLDAVRGEYADEKNAQRRNLGREKAASIAASTPPRQTFAPVDSIQVGTRHRPDLGDIAGVAESITLQYRCALELLWRPAVRRAGPRVDAARRHYRRIGNHLMSDDATLMRQLRAVRRAALQAWEEAQLAYQFAPNSYTYGALAQIELILVRLAEIEP